MDEYAALAQRVVLTMDDVRGCLVLSRDGMVLGAYPEEDEQAFKPAWLRFVNVGEARRGFVEFSDQMWAYVHRGPYAAFVVSGTAVRPGVLLDQLEQAVLAAEESRAKKGDTLKVPDAPGAPSGRPRTSLHPPADRPQVAPAVAGTAPPPEERTWAEGSAAAPPPQRPPAEVGAAGGGAEPQEQLSGWRRQAMAAEQRAAEPTAAAPEEIRRIPAEAPPAAAPTPEPVRAEPTRPREPEELTAAGRPAAFATESSPFARLEAESAAAAVESAGGATAVAPPPVAAEPTSAELLPAPAEEPSAAGAFDREPQRLVSPDRPMDEGGDEDEDELGEVDRVMLAKEFSGLLQADEDGDEDNS
ncbi:MAG TPA: hypothetical protein VK646_05555 [Actinomycetota bacterium]|nr:hypothetical protein [Actinomycetota bacterium]